MQWCHAHMFSRILLSDFLPPLVHCDILRPMERYFNIAGSCIPAKHYMLPILNRLPGVRRLIARGQYFVVHAPRQTGKMTALMNLLHVVGW